MTATTEARVVCGTKPRGTATGDERWVSIRNEDGRVIVRAFRGWGITDEVEFSGPTATAMAEATAEVLYDLLP